MTSLDKFLNAEKYDFIPDDPSNENTIQTMPKHLSGRHVTCSSNNTMVVYSINKNKGIILKIFDVKENKWFKYQIKNSKFLDSTMPYICNVAVCVINYQQNIKSNRIRFFIKYTYKNDQILCTVLIDRINHSIIEEQRIPNLINGICNDISFSANILDGWNAYNFKFFEYDNKCHILMKLKEDLIENKPLIPTKICNLSKSIRKNYNYYIIGVYNKNQNKFMVKNYIKVHNDFCNLNVVTFRNDLYLFETYTHAGHTNYYCFLHKYDTNEWSVSFQPNAPKLIAFCTVIPIKPNILVIFENINNKNIDDNSIYLFNTSNETFSTVKLKIPICADFCGVNLEPDKFKFETLVYGFTRKLNPLFIIHYLLQIIVQYYSDDHIYLLCSSVDECLQYIWNQNTDIHNYYRFRTWQIPVDCLFI